MPPTVRLSLLLSPLLALALWAAAAFAEELPSWKDLPATDAQQVAITQEAVRATLAGQKQELVAWRDIQEIRIVTTDQGPAAEDVFWVFLHHDGKRLLRVPGSLVDDAALDLLMQLARFDHDQFIKSMGSADNAVFRVWKKQD